jgi:hypothetical protein
LDTVLQAIEKAGIVPPHLGQSPAVVFTHVAENLQLRLCQPGRSGVGDRFQQAIWGRVGPDHATGGHIPSGSICGPCRQTLLFPPDYGFRPATGD